MFIYWRNVAQLLLRSTDDVLQLWSMFSFCSVLHFLWLQMQEPVLKTIIFLWRVHHYQVLWHVLHFSRYSSVDANRLCFHEETSLICSEALKCSLVVFLSWQCLKTSSLPGLHLNPLCFALLENLLSTIPLSPSHLSMEMLGGFFFNSFWARSNAMAL